MNINQIFQEADGKLSASRFWMAVIITSCLIFAAFIVYAKGDFPDMPQNWAMFAAGLYGLNKVPTAFSRRGGSAKKSEQPE